MNIFNTCNIFIIGSFLCISAQAMNNISFKLGTIENKTDYDILISGFGISDFLSPRTEKKINLPIYLSKHEIEFEAQKKGKKIEAILEIDHGPNPFDFRFSTFIELKKIISMGKRIFKDAPIFAEWEKRNYVRPSYPINYIINIIFEGEELKSSIINVDEKRILYNETKKELPELDMFLP